jgi:hypothetical protein
MSMPPSRAPGPSDSRRGPGSRPTWSARMTAWVQRHPFWSVLIAIVIVIIAAEATGNLTGSLTSAASHTTASQTGVASTPSAAVTPAAEPAPLTCQAQASSRRPRDHATVKIHIYTVAHARVTATGPLALANGQSAVGRADAAGTRTVRFRVGDATPGIRIVITVHVTRHGSKATCRASLRPRPAPAIPVATPAPPPAPGGSCHPLSNEGTCYEPGEFCRQSDAGVTGVAGDGETIICEDNDGLRWEPA